MRSLARESLRLSVRTWTRSCLRFARLSFRVSDVT